MAEIIGLGCTHYPGLLQPDARLAGGFHHLLTAPNVPAHYKDRANWPREMLAELGNDEGRAVDRALPRADVGELPQAAADDRRVRAGLHRADRRRPVRELPRGHHPAVLRASDSTTISTCNPEAQRRPAECQRAKWGEPGDWTMRIHGHRDRRQAADHAPAPGRRRRCPTPTSRCTRRASAMPSPTRSCSSTATAVASRTRRCRST